MQAGTVCTAEYPTLFKVLPEKNGMWDVYAPFKHMGPLTPSQDDAGVQKAAKVIVASKQN